MKRTTTHALIGATTLGLVVPALVAGLSTAATAARVDYTQDADMTLHDRRGSGSNGSDIVLGGPGAADLYPSSITLFGPGRVTDVNVTIGGITHESMENLDILLVGPGGQQAAILSDVGGDNPVVGIDVTLDDEAAAPLTTDAPMSGVFQPTNLEPTDEFPAPAPTPTGASALSVFDGAIGGGTWSLYVVDDDGQPAAGGTVDYWSINVSGTGQADPYPSTIAVTGALPVVKDVDVTLHGLTHTYTGDLDVLLVGPTGESVTLTSDAGSDPAEDLTVTFDDEAIAEIPDDTWVAGSFKPANYDGSTDFYEAPAPEAPGGVLLSAFDGTDPNGTWRLFINDDAGSDYGTLSGWSLSIDAVDPTAPTGTVSINGGAASTASAAVTLSLDATDPAPASGVTQMRFSNDGSTWSAWQPYAKSASWQLTAGDGVKTVSAQFADKGGNVSPAATDTITLDTTVPATDTIAPEMKKAKPESGATDVNPGAKLKVKSTEKLLRSTLTKKSVLLKKKGTDAFVKGEIGYRPLRKRIAFKPKNELDSLTKYVLIVKPTVTDRAGNAFDGDPKKPGAQPLRIKFKTR